MYSLSAKTTLHEVGDNRRVVPHKRFLGVGGILANLLVRVAERTADGLGETNLLTGFKEVLTLEDILWSKLTKVLGGRNLTGEERRGKTSTTLHTTIGRWSDDGTGSRTEWGVLALNDSVARLIVHVKEEKNEDGDSYQHKDVLLATLNHRVIFICNNFFIPESRRQRQILLGMCR
jgi:hypothetical protein